MTLAAIEERLKSRRGILCLWLATTVVVAVVAVLMQWGSVPGWDDAAHAYKVLLLRDGQSVFWDTYWYGGSYGAVTYGFIFYWLAQYVPGTVIVVLASGTIPVLYYIYQRWMWKIDDPWPAWTLMVIVGFYQAHGQDPFLLALALTLAGLVLIALRHPWWAALPVAIGVFTNPMGLAVGATFMVADFIARPERRRQYLYFFAAVAPAVALRVALGWAFTEPGSYLNETSQLMVFLSFALIGIALAGSNGVHARRPFVILFLTYAIICVISFVMPGSPLGNNTGRFFMVFGLPLLFTLRHPRLSHRFVGVTLAIVSIALFTILQLSTATNHFINREERPQTTRAYFAPALAAAARLCDKDHRVHVVAPRRHWEALYFPEAGFPITRGWYRQADAIHNSLFYTAYDASEYIAWLRSMGVRYVFSPDTLLDPWSEREARILTTSSEFELVERAGDWSVYRLRDAEPLLVGLTDGSGHVDRYAHQSITFTVDQPGEYLLKVTWTPYWVLEGGEGSLRSTTDRFVRLDLSRAGAYTLRFEITPAKACDQIAARMGL